MWVTILGFLGPILVQLAQSCGKNPVQAATDAYDPKTKTFAEPVVRQTMLHVHHAVALAKQDHRRKGLPIERVTRAEIRATAIDQLRQGLTATPEMVADCASRIADLPELDHDD